MEVTGNNVGYDRGFLFAGPKGESDGAAVPGFDST